MKIKTIFNLSLRRFLAVFMLLILVVASNIYAVSGQEFVRGYDSAAPLERGMLVRSDLSQPNSVTALTVDESESMLGVVIDPSDAPAAFSSEGEQTFVATSGQYPILVSDLNGAIRPGDLLTMSPIDGVATKADKQQPVIVGKALSGFDNNSDVLNRTSVNGRNTSLGRIIGEIGVAANPLYEVDSSYSPTLLRSIAESITDKPVSNTRLYISVAVMVMTTVLVVVLIYSGVKGGLVAIGRNPLSKNSIGKNILIIIVSATIIFSVGLLAVYLILKL